MKKQVILLALAIAVGVGCHQDSLTDHASVMPEARLKPTKPPIGRAEVLPPGTWDSPEGIAKLRTSVCDQQYVLQIKPISSNSGSFTIRVFSKDGDNYGWSSVITSIPFHTLPDTAFSTLLLYDEDSVEICFLSTDNIAFLQPRFFDEDIEFEVRFYNVSSSLNTTPQTILWEEPDRYCYSLYPSASGTCQNFMPAYCCDYKFLVDGYNSVDEGTMRIQFYWDGSGGVFDFGVPPADGDEHESTYCGAILSSWWAENHVTMNGYGELTFECDTTAYDWFIGNISEFHGILLEPDGRFCKLEY
jgi:hypothetical protein